jgi:hypothetical protein
MSLQTLESLVSILRLIIQASWKNPLGQFEVTSIDHCSLWCYALKVVLTLLVSGLLKVGWYLPSTLESSTGRQSQLFWRYHFRSLICLLYGVKLTQQTIYLPFQRDGLQALTWWLKVRSTQQFSVSHLFSASIQKCPILGQPYWPITIVGASVYINRFYSRQGFVWPGGRWPSTQYWRQLRRQWL